MAKLTISSSDMSRGIPAPEGWYKAKFIAFDEQVNSKKDGINYVPTFEFTDKQDVTRKIQTWFSNKALNLAFAQFVSAVLDHKLNPSANLDVDTDDIRSKANPKTGVEVWIKVSQDFYQGRAINKLDSYLPASEEVPF